MVMRFGGINSLSIPRSSAGRIQFKTPHSLRMLAANSVPHRGQLSCADTSSDSDEEEVIVAPIKRVVRINVGGVVFETSEDTMKKQKTLLSKFKEDCGYYNAERREYFIDREPEVFRSVLNYHRLGELHLPLHVCGPLLEKELSFWGIKDSKVEKCCWIHYMQMRAQKLSLTEFERFFADDMDFVDVTRFQKLQKYVSMITNKPCYNLASRIYFAFTAIIVILSIFSFVAETSPAFHFPERVAYWNDSANETRIYIHQEPWQGLEIIDYICATVFTLDIILRLICSQNICGFIQNKMTWIEVMAVVPYYCDIAVHLLIPPHTNIDRLKLFVQAIHVVRILGILRIFKILRHYSGLQVLVYTLRTSYKDILLMCVFICMATLFFASLIYYVDDNTVFTSIPTAFWWSVITMTTVGYGDFYPRQPLGYLVGSVCAFVGVMVIALTVPILVNNFMLYYAHAHSIMRLKQRQIVKINPKTGEVEKTKVRKTLTKLLRPKVPQSFLMLQKKNPAQSSAGPPSNLQHRVASPLSVISENSYVRANGNVRLIGKANEHATVC